MCKFKNYTQKESLGSILHLNANSDGIFHLIQIMGDRIWF